MALALDNTSGDLSLFGATIYDHGDEWETQGHLMYGSALLLDRVELD